MSESTNDVPNPLARFLLGVLVILHVAVTGIFAILIGTLGLWFSVIVTLGIIVGAHFLDPTFGQVVAFVVFGLWGLWALLKVVLLFGGKRLQELIESRLPAGRPGS